MIVTIIPIITPLHIENAQPESLCSLTSSHERGVLNVQRCKYFFPLRLACSFLSPFSYSFNIILYFLLLHRSKRKMRQKYIKNIILMNFS